MSSCDRRGERCSGMAGYPRRIGVLLGAHAGPEVGGWGDQGLLGLQAATLCWLLLQAPG